MMIVIDGVLINIEQVEIVRPAIPSETRGRGPGPYTTVIFQDGVTKLFLHGRSDGIIKQIIVKDKKYYIEKGRDRDDD